MRRKRYILLYPLSLIYGAVTGFRNFLYNSGTLKSTEFRIPVICVGNITVGGTGKTPHCEYLIGVLKDHFRVALLSRGYRRKSSGFIMADPAMSTEDVGDEPLQICRKYPGVAVAVDRNRVNGINTILKERPDTEVVVLDDAFQHRQVTPGLSILLTDYNRLMIDDFLLPYGELRENKNNMYRADVILITKSPAALSPIQRRLIVKNHKKAAYQNLYFTSFAYMAPEPVFPDTEQGKIQADQFFRTKPGVVLVTGIANPWPLQEYLSEKVSELVHLRYPDHHGFTEGDISEIAARLNEIKTPAKHVLTTEKDAMRLREITNIAEQLRSRLFYIPVGIDFLNEDREEFDKLIIDYVRKNKRNNRIP